MKKDRNTKRRLQLNKLTKQERAMKEAKKAAFAHPVNSAHILMASDGATTKAPLNKRLVALILAIVMVLGLIPAGIFMLRPKAEGDKIEAVDMIVRVNNDYYGTVSVPAGQIADHVDSITETLSLPEGCTFERAIMEDTNKIPSTKTTIASVGKYNDNSYYSKDADTNTGTLLVDNQLLVLVYSNTYQVTKTATGGTIDCEDKLRHGNALHVTLKPDLDHTVSTEDVTYTIGGVASHPVSLTNNSFTISAAEINGDISIEVNFPAATSYTIRDASKIPNDESKYYNLYGEDGHGGITQGRGQSAVGNPSDNDRRVFRDYSNHPINSTNEQRYNPKYMNRTLDSLDFSVASNYPNLYQKLGYTNIITNSNGVITDVQPNNANAGQTAEFLVYSQSWSGNTSWILDSLTINGEYINFPSQSEITNPNNKPSAHTTLKKGNMKDVEVTVTLEEMGEGLYWKSLDEDGDFDPDVTYKRNSSSKKDYTYDGRSYNLQAWQLNSHAKKRTYYKVTVSAVHDDLEVAYNFKDSGKRTIVITDLEGIESAFAAQEHRGTIGGNPYSRFYSLPMDRNENLALDAYNEYTAYYQEHFNLYPRVPSANLYLYQVKPGYNPYTVEATAKYYHADGTSPTIIESTDPNQNLLLANGGGLPGDVIHNATQKNMETLIADWPDSLKPFAERIYDYDSPIRYWGGSNSDGADYNLVNKSTKGKQFDWQNLNSDIPLLLESIKDYENTVKETKSNYKIYAIALLENEAMHQELKLKARPYKYQVLFDLDGGNYATVPNGLIATETAGVYTRGENDTVTKYTLENGATSTNMPKGEPTKANSIFLGWQLYKDGEPVNSKKIYSSNEVFAIDEDSVWYAEGDVTKDDGHTFTFKAAWEDKETSENYANVHIVAKHQTVPNGTDDDYDIHYDETEAQVIGDSGDTVLLNLHDDFEKSEYYTLNLDKSQLATKIKKNDNNELYATYDLTLCDVTVTKKVIGSPKTAKEFPITIVLTYDDESPIDFDDARNNVITINGTSVSGTVDESAKTITYTVNFKRSQSITLSNVPYGWKVNVSEPFAAEKPNGNAGELDYTTTITSDPATAGSEQEAQDATVWEGVVKKDTVITVTNKSESFLDLSKTLDYGENGTYDLRLTAYANGSIKNETEIITEQIPTDYVLVVDQSESMNTVDMPTQYTPGPDVKDWTISEALGDGSREDAKYIKVGNDYYRVYGKRGYLYEWFDQNELYSGQIIDTDALGWFQRETDEDKAADSEYFYNPYLDGSDSRTGDSTDNHFYPLKVSVKGEAGYYSIKLRYTDSNGSLQYLNYPDQPWYKTPNGSIGEYFKPNQSWGIISYGAANIAVKALTRNDRAKYTYGEVDILQLHVDTGMYIRQELFRRHVGYNQLCYKDKYGVEHILINASFCDSNGNALGGYCDPNQQGYPVDTYPITEQSVVLTKNEEKQVSDAAKWHGELYSATSWEARMDATKEALKKFINSVSAESDNLSENHRIALVGFSSTDQAYNNTEILSGVTVTNNNGPQYGSSEIVGAYKTALLDAVEKKQELLDDVDYYTTAGSTEPEKGLEIAQNIFEQRDDKTYPNFKNEEKDRNTIILFFTDGCPGTTYGDQYKQANVVVDRSYQIKTSTAIRNDHEPGKTLIYTVGLFGESDGNPLTYTREAQRGKEYVSDWNRNLSTALNDARNLRDANTFNEDTMVNLAEVYKNGFLSYRARRNNSGDPIKADAYIQDDNVGTIFSHTEYQGYAWYQYNYTFRKWQVGETGYSEQPNDTIADYMSVVSSEYKEATKFDPGVNYTDTNFTEERVNSVRKSRDTNTRYYYNATSGAQLDKIFEEIAETIPDSNTVITLDSDNSVLRDVINGEDFLVPDNDHKPIIRAWVEEVTLSGPTEDIPEPESDRWIPVAGGEIDPDYIHYENGVIDVQGFDYAANFVGYDNVEHKGQRLVVVVEGLTPKKDAVGELESNKDTSGVYKLNDSGEVLLDAFNVPNLYRYAYHLKETGHKTNDKFDIALNKEAAPDGILVSYTGETGNIRSTSPLVFDGNNTVTWGNAETDNTIFFETKSDAPVKLTGNVTSSTKDEDNLLYDISWENEAVDPPFGTDFAMYKNDTALESSTILVHNAVKYRDVTINLTADSSPYVTAGHEFEVAVDLTGSGLGDKLDALNAINASNNVAFSGSGNKLAATIKLTMEDDESIPIITFQIPDGAELIVNHSDAFYTTDEPYTYTDESFGSEDPAIAYTPHEITLATTINIHDTYKDIIDSGFMDETNGSHIILYILAGMAVLSTGAGVAYIYRKKDEFIEQ